MLIVTFIFNILIVPNTAFGQTYNVNDTKNIKMIKVTDNEFVYTYERNGKKYKNIDLISSSQMNVNSQIYLFNDSEYSLVDTIDTNIKGDIMIIHSNKNNSYAEIKISSIVSENSNYTWKYVDKRDGDTSIENLTMGAIATAIAVGLASLTGVPWGAKVLAGVAAYLFDKNLKTVYYRVYKFVDDTCPLRPAYKHEVYFYEDSGHDKFIKHKTKIYDASI